MLLHRWHFWPNAGHFFFACDVPHLRQVPRDDCCLLFAARDGIDGLLLFERPCFITFTFVLAAMSFTWCSICSAALMRSTAFCIVKLLYRSSPSRILSSRIDLFSLYVLFSHFRPRDATRGNSFFEMPSYARANVCITNEKNKRKIPMRASRGLKWENKMYKLKRSIPKTILSRKISSGVISSCWQFLATVLSTVRYAAMFSAGSCLRLLNRYRSYITWARGSQYASNFASTCSIYESWSYIAFNSDRVHVESFHKIKV